MEATVHLQFAKHNLKNSESMRAKMLWSDDLQLNFLGRAPSTISEHQALLTVLVVKPDVTLWWWQWGSQQQEQGN